MTRANFSVNQILARASSCAKKGDLEKAQKYYLKVLAAYPKNKTAQQGLEALNRNASGGNRPVNVKQTIKGVKAHCAAGGLDQALSEAKRLCRTHPGIPSFHDLLGDIHIDRGELVEGVASYRRALKIDPKHADANFHLGNVFMNLKKPDNAETYFRKALAAKPEYSDVHNNLGIALNQMGKFDAAKSCYEKAVQLKPDFLEAHNNLGILLSNCGEIELAIDSFERALEINPDHAEVHRNIALYKKYEPGDARIEKIEQLLANPDTRDSDRKFLCLTLAKIYEDFGNYEQSIQMLNQGNRIRKKELNYRLSDDELLTAETKNLFSAMQQSRETISSESPAAIEPIFIVGMPRSGTTLVEQILASHSRVYGAGELDAFGKMMFLARHKSREDKTDQEETPTLPGLITDLRAGYIKALEALDASEPVIIDKMPMNFRWIGFILTAFPDAKIINLNRDPRAVCWSCYKHYFPSGYGFTFDLRDLANFYSLYRGLMSYWRKCFPGKIYDLGYEDLTREQEAETRKLLAYCKLDWEEQCLNFHETQRPVITASSVQVRKPMYRGSSESWRKFESYLQPLLKELNDRENLESV